MKSLSLFLALLVAVSAFAGDGLDSLLTVQRTRAGVRVNQIFNILDKSENSVTEQERADLRFLIAYMPLSDLASMTGDALLDNVRLARQAEQDFPWGKQVDDELFRSFVLPYRVSQEPFVQGWRDQFLYELQPRLKNMTMTEAALEVNHWCHEKVTYQPSDSRDQDPLTTIRAGLGRCEEEMIFAICALRSVGIPARQCYTPYWAHTDDNHAWTEVWADGHWHYFGACEPEPVLDKGWFTNSAARTMLVVSQSYGDYHGTEPVLRRYGRSTLINSTAVYGNTRKLTVTLLDENGKPLPKTKAIFNLFNYGCLMPAMALETGADGTAKITCGLGDWFISAGKDSLAALKPVKAGETSVTLKLDKTENLAALSQAFYAPPPEVPPKNLMEQDSLFKCRLHTEDSLREGVWHVWADDLGNITGREYRIARFQLKPDSVWVTEFASERNLDSAKLLETFRNARGNWGNLFRFLTGQYPMSDVKLYDTLSQTDLDQRMMLLDNLTEKDARDFNLGMLADDYARTTIEQPLAWPETWSYVSSLDSADRQRYEECVLAPRINYEPSLPWRGALYNFFKTHLDLLISSKDDERMIEWLRKNIALDEEHDRLGSPLTPAQTLDIMRGSQGDIERLYVGLCRVRGIPARFNPVTDRLERWDNSAWTVVDMRLKAKGKSEPVKTGKLTVEAASDSVSQNALYFKEWGVSLWQTDHLEPVDFGYHQPFSKVTWPQELPTGLYCLTSGIRNKNGSAPVAFNWFRIEPEKDCKVKLTFSK
jgi:transglutaminase-like putative cysteine protease